MARQSHRGGLAVALGLAMLIAGPAAARPVSEANLSSAEARVMRALSAGNDALAGEEAVSLLTMLTDDSNSFPDDASRVRALKLARDALEKVGRSADAQRAADALGSAPDDSENSAAVAAQTPAKDGVATFAELAAAARDAPRSGDGSAAIDAYAMLADHLENASKLTEAADAYRELLALQVQFQPSEIDERIGTVRKLIWVLDQLGRNGEAISLARNTLPLAEKAWRDTGATETYNGSFNSLGAAMSISSLQIMLAGSLTRQGDDIESDALFAKALAWRNRYFTRQIAQQANVYNQMAFYRNFRGRFADAEVSARTALSIMQNMGSDDWEPDITLAKYKYNLAAALLGRGEAREAIPLLRYGVPVQRGEFAPDHPDLAILLTTLSRALVTAKEDPVEALALAREAAGIARGHRNARMIGGTVVGSETAAIARAVAGDPATNDPLGMAYGALLEAGMAARGLPNTDAATLFQESFVAAQDIEQSVAGQAMATAAVRRFGGSGPLGALIGRKQKLTERARAANSALPAALASGEATQVERLRSELRSIAADLAAADAALARDHPALQQLITPQSAVPAAIQARLGADEALLLFVPSGESIYAFGLTRDAQFAHVIDRAADAVTAGVRRLRCRVDEAACASEDDFDSTDPADRSGTDAYFPRFDVAVAHQLYRDLIAPFDAMLAGKTNVFVTASGPLSGLPLSMLLTQPAPADGPQANDSKRLQSLSWLGDRHSFVTLPSVAALTVVRDAAAQGNSNQRANAFVGYGAPTLSGSEATTRSVESGGRRAFRSGVAGVPPTNALAALRALASLPGTEVELSQMAATLGAGASTMHIGAAATEAAVRADAALTRADVITFATHGLLPREIGSNVEPGLVFTPPTSASAHDDGLLTASEAAELKLSADWLILSACNTASADGTANGQSLSGLARSFLHAGAKSLLVSHWRVSDDVTAALTVETIRLNRLQGLARPQALQAATQAVRSGKRRDGTPMPGWKAHWAHPAAWSPFVVVAGDAR